MAVDTICYNNDDREKKKYVNQRIKVVCIYSEKKEIKKREKNWNKIL